jgi:hypothetical protein
MARYNIYPGTFPCHTCNLESKTIRSYPGQKKLSWMCPDKHLNEINLDVRKDKKDFERKERE